MTMKPMREDEEVCKAAFHAFLTARYDLADIVWKNGDRKKPPDYYLSLGGTKYAVEVTQLWELSSIGNKPLSDLDILVTVRRFLEEIEREASASGILTGAYSVRFKPLNNFGKLQQQIEGEITDYLRSTQNMSSAAERVIVEEDNSRWEIKKLHADRTYLSCGFTDGKWHGEAIRDLSTLLDRVLITKARKLAAIPKPWILLIADRYPWLDHSDWHESAIGLKSIGDFHTVFLVSGDKGNHVLYSQNIDWLGS
jgi:hypothetical protein